VFQDRNIFEFPYMMQIFSEAETAIVSKEFKVEGSTDLGKGQVFGGKCRTEQWSVVNPVVMNISKLRDRHPFKF